MERRSHGPCPRHRYLDPSVNPNDLLIDRQALSSTIPSHPTSRTPSMRRQIPLDTPHRAPSMPERSSVYSTDTSYGSPQSVLTVSPLLHRMKKTTGIMTDGAGSRCWTSLSHTSMAILKISLPRTIFPSCGISPLQKRRPLRKYGPVCQAEFQTIHPLTKNPIVQVYVVDIPSPRHIAPMLKWVQQSGLDDPELGHLKRIRKALPSSSSSTSTAPLETPPTPPISTSTSTSSTLLISTLPPPPLPPNLDLGSPYQVTVPRTAALTPRSLELKNALWPTVYAPRRKGETEPWTRGQARWAWEAMRQVVTEAQKARDAGEVCSYYGSFGKELYH